MTDTHTAPNVTISSLTQPGLRWVCLDPHQPWVAPAEAELHRIVTDVVFLPRVGYGAGEWTLGTPRRHADSVALAWNTFWAGFVLEGCWHPIVRYPQSNALLVVTALRCALGQVARREARPSAAIELALERQPRVVLAATYAALDRAAARDWRKWSPGWDEQSVAAIVIESAIRIAIDVVGAPQRAWVPPSRKQLVVEILGEAIRRIEQKPSTPIDVLFRRLTELRHSEVREDVYLRLAAAAGRDVQTWAAARPKPRATLKVLTEALGFARHYAGITTET